MGLSMDTFMRTFQDSLKNIEKSLVEAFKPLGISDWNSIFWIAQSSGPATLDQVEAKLGLKADKLGATRHVLS